jgi:hypothetical protein
MRHTRCDARHSSSGEVYPADDDATEGRLGDGDTVPVECGGVEESIESIEYRT